MKLLFALLLLQLLQQLCHSFLTDPRHFYWRGAHGENGGGKMGTMPGNERTLPMCRVCMCRQHARSVECAPRHEGDKFPLRMVGLPAWAESLSMFNLTLSAFPHFASAPRLRLLHLRHCSIGAPLHPKAFVPLSSLESVHLTDSRFNALPPALFRPLTRLRELFLSGNAFRSVRIELDENQILNRLDLSQNPLCPAKTTKWPPTRQLTMENANVLALNGTHWTFGEAKMRQNESNELEEQCHLSISATHWHALEQLRIGENSALKLHASALPRLAPLRHLELSNAGSVPEELFLEWMGRAEVQWRHIDLRRAKIELAPEPQLYYKPKHMLLKELQLLINVPIQRHEYWTICSTKLEWLDISELGLEGKLRLDDGCGQLKWLYADGNALDAINVDRKGPAALRLFSARDNRLRRWPRDLVHYAHSLTTVQLANNSIPFLPLEFLVEFTQLNALDLSQNRLFLFHEIHKEDNAVFGDLDKMKHLMFLNLSHNQLDSVELPMPSLTVLDLSDNNLTKFDAIGHLPALEHLHLSGNAGVQLAVDSAEHPVLIQLDIANCSLTKMPDLSRLVALTELDLRDNQLEEVPGNWLPPRGVNVLDVSSNSLRELGWDWRAQQLDALQELRATKNPWQCACAFVPPLGHLLTKQNQSTLFDFCPPSPFRRRWHALDALLLLHKDKKGTTKCAREEQWKRRTMEHNNDNYSSDFTPNPLVLFLLPLALIAGAFVSVALLVRGSAPKTAKWRRRASKLCSSPSIAYHQLVMVQQPNGEAI